MQVPKAVVCLPTYNERENLEPMLRALGEEGVRVLVIDDNSPDGTGKLADRLATELGYVDVLHRESKEGLGPAYLAGFRVVELPITFTDREAGSSKMSGAIVLEAIWRVPYIGLLAVLRRLR